MNKIEQKLKDILKAITNKETVIKNAFGLSKKNEPNLEKVLETLTKVITEMVQDHSREIEDLKEKLKKLEKRLEKVERNQSNMSSYIGKVGRGTTRYK